MEIVFDNVTYKENSKTPLERTYLKNISFKINESKVYAFLGDSKSGKEKIASLINATAKPYKGKIIIGDYVNDGRYIKKVNNLRMNVSHVKALPSNMLFNKYVKNELNFGLKYFKYKLNKQEIREKEALSLVGLNEEYLNKKISSLNINEKKKVSIAAALIFNPNIIILEEPSLFLKNKDKESLKRLINNLTNKQGKTVIIITNDTSFAYEIADYMYILNDGEIVKEGNKDLLTDENLLNEYNLIVPEIIKFINAANKRGANLTYTNNILDLIKEVYRNAH